MSVVRGGCVVLPVQTFAGVVRCEGVVLALHHPALAVRVLRARLLVLIAWFVVLRCVYSRANSLVLSSLSVLWCMFAVVV